MSYTIETPNHGNVVYSVAQRQPTFATLQSVVNRLADVAGYSLLESMQGHNRTGLTVRSIEAWTVAMSTSSYAVAVGSRTRGMQLKWLDRGRGEVRPKHLTKSGELGYLKFVAKDGATIFTRYCRPTQGVGLMERARGAVQAQAERILAETLQ